MKVLGLGTEGDSGAAIIEDGRIIAAVNEERLSRIKLVTGFPRDSIREVLRLSGTTINELNAVLIGGKEDLLVDELKPFDGWFQYKPSGIAGMIKRSTHLFARYRNELPFLETAYYAMLEPTFRRRRNGLERILQDEFGVRCRIDYVDHHFCHITSAYFTSGFEDALVVSLDGGGDAKSGRVYAVRNGQFEELDETSTYNSLGNYYAYITHLCGFKAMKHEGKITGLAAHGEPKYLDLLREFIDFEDGQFINKGRVVFQSALAELERRLPTGWTREDLAASIQIHFEELVVQHVRHWVQKTGLSKVAVAGGVFANVRVNQEVHKIPEVSDIHVHPGMSDGGLAVGAGLAASVPGTLKKTMPAAREPIADVYLGTNLTDGAIQAALKKFNLDPEAISEPIEDAVADLLVQGYVVARANGRMEYGPRALGNRSILYQPTDRAVNDWLNVNLKRTEFMPFAPSTLYEARDRCYENVEGAEHSAEFMTITFNCTPWMRENMKGVVHIDGTARPQLVRKDRNPSYYRIIEAFYERTGLPAIINTSFNMHEEPIVCTAEDCVRAFIQGNLDYLAIGNYLVKHPEGINHPLKPVKAVQRA